ncbi:response regulator transcription factor [Actinophytocola sp.]|uniref:helix-turn-helix transcriptional regulator n=1 Tax=Actinophytocola sp. TaxID=1872138 RepID=UPI00389AD349
MRSGPGTAEIIDETGTPTENARSFDGIIELITGTFGPHAVVEVKVGPTPSNGHALHTLFAAVPLDQNAGRGSAPRSPGAVLRDILAVLHVHERAVVAALVLLDEAGTRVHHESRSTDHTAKMLLALTTRELEVARHIALGRTNREIAGAMFVTAKAIEYHLSNIYRKLRIVGRRQLRDIAQHAYGASVCNT